jgi:hypothetical protein
VKEYQCQVGDQSLSYSETMTEIKLCIDVAAQMIQLFKIDDSNFHAIFQQLTNKYEAFDRKSLEIENRMVKYNQRLQSTNMFASKYQRYFKRSKDREFVEDEFIPINVHLQNFNIGKIADYKTISCGAAAAHSKGFKGSNGLWQHLEVSVDQQIPDEDFGRTGSCLRYQRHCVATVALLNLSSQWGGLIIAIDQLKQKEISVEDYIQAAKSLLSRIIESIRSEIDDQNVQNIRESARMCADIIKNCHSSLSAAEFAQTTKVALQKAYTECLEFLIFRALPVILTDDLQQRVDIIQSNIVGIAVAAILTKVSSSESPEELLKLKQMIVMLMVLSLLSEYGKETGMMGDYAFGSLILLERASFVLTPQVSELTIEGNRLAPRVLIPCMPELLVGNDDSTKSENVAIEFKIVPIFINIGINEKQSLTDAMAKDNKKSIIDEINKISLYKLFKWVKTNIPSEDSNILLNGKLQLLKEEIYAKKKKNVSIHKITSAIIRDLGGTRVINCKSGKDRTGMAVTLEQTRFLSTYGLPNESIEKCLAEMRSQGVRRDNCRKNQDRYLYAFTGIQLQTFPSEYRPPKGSYGHAET